jgi:hypothetical protein
MIDKLMASGGVIVAKHKGSLVVAAGSMLRLYEYRVGHYEETEVITTSTRSEDMTIAEARDRAQQWLRDLYNLGQGYRF